MANRCVRLFRRNVKVQPHRHSEIKHVQYAIFQIGKMYIPMD